MWFGTEKTDRWTVDHVIWHWETWQVDIRICDLSLRKLTGGQWNMWFGTGKTDRWTVKRVFWHWENWQVDSGSCDLAMEKLAGWQWNMWFGTVITDRWVVDYLTWQRENWRVLMKRFTKVCRLCQLIVKNCIVFNCDSLERNLNTRGGLMCELNHVWGCTVSAVHKNRCTTWTLWPFGL